jgi:hypothetical protein
MQGLIRSCKGPYCNKIYVKLHLLFVQPKALIKELFFCKAIKKLCKVLAGPSELRLIFQFRAGVYGFARSLPRCRIDRTLASNCRALYRDYFFVELFRIGKLAGARQMFSLIAHDVAHCKSTETRHGIHLNINTKKN